MAITLQIRFFVTLASSAKMGVTGLELAENSLVRAAKLANCGTTSGPVVPKPQFGPFRQDPELQELVDTWASLSAAVRSVLLEIVRRARDVGTN